jgi:hypothetical protein
LLFGPAAKVGVLKNTTNRGSLPLT